MGSFLSLPLPLDILSLIIVPSAVSYATSANLLFFYVNWVSLIFSHSPLRLEIVGTLVVKCLFYIIPSWFLWMVDLLLVQQRVEDDDGTGKKKKKKERTMWERLKVAIWSTLNVILGLIIQVMLELVISKILKWDRLIRTTIMLPLPLDIAFSIVKAVLLREVISYFLHRFVLHDTLLPRSLSYFTRNHKLWYHALPNLGPLSATYDHPACYIINRFAPTFLSAIILRLHLVTYMLYLILVSCEETLAYCDFNFVSMGHMFVVVGHIGRVAQRHLKSRGRGEFGVYGLMDWALGTAVVLPPAKPQQEKSREEVVVVKEESRRRIRWPGVTKRIAMPGVTKRVTATRRKKTVKE